MNGKKRDNPQESFAYKLYEIAFLSLLLSAFLSMLEIGSQFRLNLTAFFFGNSSLFLPVILAVAVFHVVYVKRFEFSRSMKRYAYSATVALILLTLSIFQEIVPIIMDMGGGSSFLHMYAKNAVIHPLSIILLSISYFWLYHRAFHKRPPWLVVLPVGFIFIELIILGFRITEIFGRKSAIIITFVLLVILAVTRHFWWRD